MNRKIMISTIIGILLITSIAFNIVDALPLDNTANRLTQATWIRINGNIDYLTLSGTPTEVRGQLQTQARVAVHQLGDTKQLTAATATWTTETKTAVEKAKESNEFTYTYYIARLPNALVSDTSKITTPANYILAGTWNLATVVLTVTTQTNEDGTVTKHRTQDITTSPKQGTLTVIDNTFSLDIDGLGVLTGSVYRSITRSWFNPFKMSDDSTTSTVTRSDVKLIAQNYGVMPGWGNFNSNMDFNNNFRVDIADISTVAANM